MGGDDESCGVVREEMTSSCARGGLNCVLWNFSSPKELSSIGTGCPGKWWSHIPGGI